MDIFSLFTLCGGLAFFLYGMAVLSSRLGILRAGLAEFPQNEKLRITLADTLSEAGWRRYQEWLYYDGEGYLRRDYDRHRKN